MNEHVVERHLLVKAPLEQVFAFFADAANLEMLTPPWLKFKILTPLPIAMHVGALIDYKLKFHGLPIRWRTLISAWEPPTRFVDEQLRGPYRLWHHEHRFEAVDGGTLVKDRVCYAVLGGALVDWLFVRSDLRRIFDYRHDALLTHFEQEGKPLVQK